ncbi:MAG: glutathione S-transferase N-terminal domain-containing protein [Myxococcota bacterium]
MLRLHHLNDSRSTRILWLLEELGLEYELVEHRRNPRTQLAPKVLAEAHPLGKAPILEHDGKALAESGAIVEYLVENFGPAWGAPAEDREGYRFWLHYAEGSVMPILLLKLIMDKIKSQSPFLVRPVGAAIRGLVYRAYLGAQLKLHADFLERSLEGRDWLLGDRPTAADVMMSFPVEGMVARGVSGERHPRTRAYWSRMRARPGYQQAMVKGGEPAL